MRAGIIIDGLGFTQKAMQTTLQMNLLDRLDEYWDMVLFYVEHASIQISPRFAMMDSVEMYGFDAPVIATDLRTAFMLSEAHSVTQKYFYIWDFEWINSVFDVDLLLSIYHNPDIELIARSDEHADIIAKCWKNPIAVIENFNHEQITKLLKDTGKEVLATN